MFPQRLRELRIEYGYTQAQLGKKLGLEGSAIYKYEKGLREPTITVLTQLANIFNVTTDYLLGNRSKIDDEFIAIYETYKEIDDEDKEVLKAMFEAIKKKRKK